MVKLNKPMKKLIISLAIFLSITGIAQAKSGCCSWHDGVCGCDTDTGKQQCCDGTDSPSCTCEYIKREPIIDKVIKDPSPTPKSSDEIIKNDIINSKEDYYSNPNGYRENKIRELILRFPSLGQLRETIIPYYVYTLLPDVK